MYSNRLLLLLISKLLVASPFPIFGQAYTNLVDPTFDPGTGPFLRQESPNTFGQETEVSALAIDSAGRIIAGGWFIQYQGEPRAGLARIHADGSLDSTFVPALETGSSIAALTVQPDGKIIVVGRVSKRNESGSRLIARLNPDGSWDDSFDAGINPPRPFYEPAGYCLALQPDGKILLGGFFVEVAGQPIPNIVRLNVDGRPDPQFIGPDPQIYRGGAVLSLALQPDKHIVIAGPINIVVGNSLRQLARLRPDGTLDNSFQMVMEQVPERVALQSDGKILVSFANRIWRLGSDGNIDPTYTRADLSDGGVETLVVRPDDRILLGGSFKWVNGIFRGGIAQLDRDGNIDLGFDPGPGVEYVHYPAVTAILPQSNGKLLVGGTFRKIAGVPRNFIARLNASGPASENAFVFEGSPRAFFAQNEGAGGVSVPVIRWGPTNLNVSVDVVSRSLEATAGVDFPFQPILVTFAPGQRTNRVFIPFIDDRLPESHETFRLGLTNASPFATVAAPGEATVRIVDDDCVVGFSTNRFMVRENAGVALVAIQKISWSCSGPMPLTFEMRSGTATANFDFPATRLSVQFMDVGHGVFASYEEFLVPLYDDFQVEGNESIILRLFDAAGNMLDAPESKAELIILDDDNEAGSGKGLNGIVHSSFGLPNGTAILAGDFTSVDGTNRNRVARFNLNGTFDGSFGNHGSGPDGPAYFALPGPGDTIVISGAFASVDQVPRRQIARLTSSGFLDRSFDPGASWQGPATPYNPRVTALAVQPDGKVLTAGTYTNFGGVFRPGMARLNPDGSLDLQFTPEPGGGTTALVVQPDGRILSAGGIQVVRLLANGARDPDFQSDSRTEFNGITSMALQPDGKIIIGGERGGVARLLPDGRLDDSFKLSPNSRINAVVVQPDGKILAGGNYFLGRLTTNGDWDINFSFRNSGVVYTPGVIYTLALLADGQVWAGGSWPDYVPDHFLERYRPDGQLAHDLKIERIHRSASGEAHLSFAGQSAVPYDLEASSNFEDWTPLMRNRSPVPVGYIDTNAPAFSQRFYRIRSLGRF